jgi:hypothetical protein
MPAAANALELFGPISAQLYQDLLQALKRLGDYHPEPNKSSIHVVRMDTVGKRGARSTARGSTFLGVRPRKEYLLLTFKAAEEVKHKRVFKAERASTHRWYCEVKLTSAAEIDAQLMKWIAQSYELSQ